MLTRLVVGCPTTGRKINYQRVCSVTMSSVSLKFKSVWGKNPVCVVITVSVGGIAPLGARSFTSTVVTKFGFRKYTGQFRKVGHIDIDGLARNVRIVLEYHNISLSRQYDRISFFKHFKCVRHNVSTDQLHVDSVAQTSDESRLDYT